MANYLSLLGENFSDSRQFPTKNYTVSGRSLTAKLGADYAKNQIGVVTQALYARQIVEAQLRYTDFKLGDWMASNWLIHANLFVLTALEMPSVAARRIV